MALHAAQQVGIEVPKEIIDEAVAYAQRKVRPDGGVGYTSANRDHPALRGLGAPVSPSMAQEDQEEVERIVQRIRRDPVAWKELHGYFTAPIMTRLGWPVLDPKLGIIMATI